MSGEKLSAHLSEHGVTPTAQRLKIATVLFCKPQHLSAEQILAAVNREHPVVSKATVYNTLKLLTAKGLVREVIVDPARVFYDPTTGSHHHFYNADTGELMDIEPEQVRFAQLPQLPPGTRQDGVDVIVRLRGDNKA
ncbi:MAG: transcriptional repressor [Gammaproteobacteria bacterium]|nr:transcriptional repressor [Gammaproteobacteria bacterium]MDE2344991.1 transcriptional repressor [Gammaproteobacteria bacterium]